MASLETSRSLVTLRGRWAALWILLGTPSCPITVSRTETGNRSPRVLLSVCGDICLGGDREDLGFEPTSLCLSGACQPRKPSVMSYHSNPCGASMGF